MSDSPALDAVLLLTRANSAAHAALEETLGQVGLALDELSLLTFVRDAGSAGLQRAALASALRLPQSETLRRAKQLEKLNRLERSEDGAFVLTGGGRTLLDEATGLAARRSRSWLAESLSAEQVASLAYMLRELT
jgi:DNA-binding MarR family transcriptional regulator